jgi:hypothetical protein
MMKRVVALLVMLTLLLGSTSALAAQDATPEAGGGEKTTGGGDPKIGDEVQYLSDDGDENAVIIVTKVTDPFDDFSEYFRPEKDARYVAVEIAVESTGDQIDISAYNFGLQTMDGFFYSPTYASREDGARPVDLENGTVQEGDNLSGVIFYAVPEKTELSRLLWQPESGRLLVVADLRDADSSQKR